MRCVDLLFARGPATAHQQVEGERAGENMIFVKLRRLSRELVPCVAERVPVETVEQQQARVRSAQSDQQRGERRLSAAGAALDEKAFAVLNRQTCSIEHRLILCAIAIDQA